MKTRAQITLFPFLSVLLSTMGILSFLAVTFLLMSRPELSVAPAQKPIEVRWVGAPSYVRPVLVECLKDEVRIHVPNVSEVRRFTRDGLHREAERVREWEVRGLERLGPVVEREQMRRLLKQSVRGDTALRGTLTAAFDQIEQDNLSGRARGSDEVYHPVLLVYPDGIDTYDLVSYLIETTTRLPVGIEPMLKGWTLPYIGKRA
jgi:hypothetical protein